MQKLIRNEIFVLFVLCLVSSSFLIYAITNLSISYYEAEIFYHDRGLTGIIARLSCEIFGQNDFALRSLTSIFLHPPQFFLYCFSFYVLDS